MPRNVPSLRRRKSYVKPKKKFVLFCEGKNTEPEYFLFLSRSKEFALVDIVTFPNAGVPKTIADKAIQDLKSHRRKKRKDSFEESDEFWAIFDRDEHPNFSEAVQQCEVGGVGVARSNPCFEVWLYLHFGDYEKPSGRHDVQKDLEAVCPGYKRDKGKIAEFSKLLGGLEDAEARAERQLANRDREGSPYGPPSTTVFHLTRRLRGK